jgi:glycosyltransferase involved in cell wall biosynthesis
MQNYGNLEILIYDNASDDDTGKICREVATQDCRVKYLRHERNIGAERNFELLVRNARGKYFSWLAHDDVINSPDYIAACVSFLEANRDVVCCACDWNILDENGVPIKIQELTSLRQSVPWRKARRSFFRFEWSNVIYSIYGLFDRDTLVQAEFLEHAEDRLFRLYPEPLFLVQIAAKGRIVALPQVFRGIRKHRESAATRIFATLSQQERDRYALGFAHKKLLLQAALTSPLPIRDKLDLAITAVGNYRMQWWQVKALLRQLLRRAGLVRLVDELCRKRAEWKFEK